MKRQQISKLPDFTIPYQKRNLIVYGLKCVSVDPEISHPNRYWDKDSKKFLALGYKAVKNNADLLLVNYSDNSDIVKTIDVGAINHERGIESSSETIMSKADCRTILNDMRQTHNII